MNVPLVRRRSNTANHTITKVMVLVANGVSMTTVSATLEPFHQANSQLRCNQFNLQLVSFSDDDPVTQAGIPVPCHASSKEVLMQHDLADRPDLVILCCGQSMDPNEQALMQKFTRKLVRTCVPVFALGAACAAIAAAGLVRGGKCAAHWKTIAQLGEQFPNLEFENVLFASDDKATSCAGELATFDLIVGFIEQVCGSRISGDIYNHFLACGKRSGGSVQLLSGDALICEDGRFQRALEIMVNHIEEPVSTAELAHRLGLSRRQVERIFSRHGFEPPHKYYKNLRLQRARQLIEQTRMSLVEIAFACGFGTQSSFSRSYKRTFGIPPIADRTHKATVQSAQPPPLAFVT